MESRRKFDMAVNLLHIQKDDYFESLYLDEAILFTCRNNDLIDKIQHDALLADLKNKGLEIGKTLNIV